MRDIITALREKDIFKGASNAELRARKDADKERRAALMAKAQVKFDANKEAYLNELGKICPVCKEASGVEYTDSSHSDAYDFYYDHAACSNCGAYWTDTYKYYDTELDGVK